jgi:hypothetical protein
MGLLYLFYCSSLNGVTWMGHLTNIMDKGIADMILAEMPGERDHLEYLDTDGRITLKLILKKQGGMVWTGFTWLRRGTSSRLLWTC